MEPSPDSLCERERRLGEVIAAWLQADHAKQPLDRRQLHADCPDLAQDLAAFFEAQDHLEALAAPLRVLAPGCTRLGPNGQGRGEAAWEGQTLGDFRLVRELGRGGMGIVYEAEQVGLHRRVALKVLPLAATLDGRARQRFHTEAQAAARLHHTNIVPVYHVGSDRGVHFYAMQLIEGQSLAQLIAQKSRAARPAPGPASGDATAPHTAPTTRARARSSTARSGGDPEYYRLVARLGVQAAEALDHAHQLGVVHRDVKPANLLLDEAGTLWVTDFGLAQLQQADVSLTGTGDLVGTLRYMSPEQALAQRLVIDHRTDVYSLGATLYELLTLRPAFESTDRAELLRQVVSEVPPSPRQRDRSIPAEMETIVQKAMEKTPTDRYATALELAEDLRRFLDHRPIRARPPSLPVRLRKWTRRHQSLVQLSTALLALTSLILAVCLGWVWKTEGQLKDALGRANTFAGQVDQERQRAEAREDEALDFLHAADLKLAWNAWQNDDMRRMVKYLSRHLPQPGQKDRRSFAWHYLWRLCHHRPPTLLGHERSVYHVTFSPDGKEIASAGEDGTIRLWEAATGRRLGVLQGHRGDVNWVAYSPDGRMLLSGGDDGTTRLWQRSTMWATKVWPGGAGESVVAACFATRTRIAIAVERLHSGGYVKEWDLADEDRPPFVYPLSGRPESLACTSDGNTLAVAHRDGLAVLDRKTGKVWAQAVRPQGYPTCVAFRHGDRALAVGYTASEVVRLLGPFDAGGPPPGELPPDEGLLFKLPLSHPEAVAFSPDDRWLIGGTKNGEVHVWDVARRERVKVYRGHRGRVWCVAVSPDNSTIVSGDEVHQVCLWRLAEHQEHRALPLHRNPVNPVFSLAFTPDGKQLLTGGADGAIRLWAMPDGSPLGLLQHGTPVYSLAVTSDGRTLISGGGRWMPTFWDLPGRRQLEELSGVDELPSELSHLLYCGMALAPDDRLLAFAPARDLRSPRFLQLWDPSSRRLLRQIPLPMPGDGGALLNREQLSFSPTGQTLAHNRDALGLFLWDTSTWDAGSVIRLVGWSFSTSFTSDGRLCGCAGQGIVYIWNTPSGTLRTTLITRPAGLAMGSISPDGRTLALRGSGGSLSLWDVPTQQELFTLAGHRDPIELFVFSRDGKMLATAAAGEVFLWPAGEGP